MMKLIEGADYSAAQTDLDFIRLLKTTPCSDKERRQRMINEWKKKYEQDMKKAEDKAVERQRLIAKWAVTETTV